MDSLPAQLILQFVLIILNAFFASTEIAVISLNKQLLEEEAKTRKTAKIILKLTKNPANFLSTIQIGITLAGFLASAFAAQSFSKPLADAMILGFKVPPAHHALINTVALVIVTILLSFFTLVFGELIPKRIAMQYPKGLARITIGPVYFIYILVKPIVFLLSGITNLFLKIFRIKTDMKEQVTEEQIKLMLNVSEESGMIEENEKEWIENVFEFNDTIIREVMTPSHDVTFIKLTDTHEEIIAKITESRASRFPVCAESLNDVIGILSIKDYFLDHEKNVANLIRPCTFIPETALCDDIFRQMQLTKSNFYIVVDEYGITSGIVTMEDLIEEIVGNIYDEFDDDEDVNFTILEDGSYKMPGDYSVSELNEQINANFENSEAYDTVGGLIFSCLTSIPKDGSRVKVEKEGFEFEATKIKDRRILEVIVRKLEVKEEVEEN